MDIQQLFKEFNERHPEIGKAEFVAALSSLEVKGLVDKNGNDVYVRGDEPWK